MLMAMVVELLTTIEVVASLVGLAGAKVRQQHASCRLVLALAK